MYFRAHTTKREKYYLCLQIQLAQVIKNESNFVLHTFRRFFHFLGFFCCNQQCINVGSHGNGGLETADKTLVTVRDYLKLNLLTLDGMPEPMVCLVGVAVALEPGAADSPFNGPLVAGAGEPLMLEGSPLGS